jgi:hypothetical protein
LDLVHEFPGQIVNRKLRRQSQAKKLNWRSRPGTVEHKVDHWIRLPVVWT